MLRRDCDHITDAVKESKEKRERVPDWSPSTRPCLVLNGSKERIPRFVPDT